MVQGSSIAPRIVERVQAEAEGKRRVLAFLNSNHTHATFRRSASLLAAHHGRQLLRGVRPCDRRHARRDVPRPPLGSGNSRKSAGCDYLKTHPKFVIDKQMDHKATDQRRAGWVLEARGVIQAYDSSHHSVSEEKRRRQLLRARLASPDGVGVRPVLHQVPRDRGLWPDRHFCLAASLAGAARYGDEASLGPGNGPLYRGRAQRPVDPGSAAEHRADRNRYCCRRCARHLGRLGMAGLPLGDGKSLPVEVVAQAFAVMGLVTALRFIENIYVSSMVGLQRQVLQNAVTSITATVRGLGAVAVLAWVSPTIGASFSGKG